MIAFVFPGQGAQYVGMGKSFYESFSESREIFDLADGILHFPLSHLCFDGPNEELSRTANCQPAIFVTSIAALAAFSKSPNLLQGKSQETQTDSKNAEKEMIIRDQQLIPKYMAGLSLGEYTALVAAGALSFEDGLSLVANRARFMDEAARGNPGKMLCILGLNLDIVEKIALDSGVEIANLNCPGQVVISGSIDAIDNANDLALKHGARRAIYLEVSGAFHSSLMQPAREKLAKVINSVNIKEPDVTVVSNVIALPEYSCEQIKDNLIKQLTCSVLWEKSIRFMIKQGVDKFFEIGPGRVLKGLIRKIDPRAEVVNIEKKDDLLSSS